MQPDLARVACMIGVPARAAMLSALLGGRPLTAGELARTARVAPSTASEHLAQLVDSGLVAFRSAEFRFARMCYDHLAGALGVLLTDTLIERGFIREGSGYELTAEGEQWLQTFGINTQELRRARRTLVRPCLDWSERRHHLAGGVGAAVASVLLERGWLRRLPDTRGLQLTMRGREGLYRALDVQIPIA